MTLLGPNLVLYEEEFQRISSVLARLWVDANAKIVFLVDKNGQQIAAKGDLEKVDATSLASLTAGNVAATDGLARLIGEKEFSILFHEGERDNIHISIVGQRLILVVIFDERSSLGLVRLRVRKTAAELEEVINQMASKAAEGEAPQSPVRRDHRRRHRQPLLRMSFINYASREINCKIVYYGPGLGGKTTNLQYIYEKTNPQNKGKLISLATETDRTLFFDFLPLDLGTVRGFRTRFHLYTVPGQVFYDASRKLILKGVDGVIFVADSQEARMDANVESLDNLKINLRENGFDLDERPLRPAAQQARPAQRRRLRGDGHASCTSRASRSSRRSRPRASASSRRSRPSPSRSSTSSRRSSSQPTADSSQPAAGLREATRGWSRCSPAVCRARPRRPVAERTPGPDGEAARCEWR